MENKRKMYNIVTENGDYFCYNGFNGDAHFLPVENGEKPSIAFEADEALTKRKIDYLTNHTWHKANKRKNGSYDNNFTELKAVEVI